MKITKTPKRKPEVFAEVASLCARVAQASDAELADVLLGVQQWEWPRGDLYTWTGVLNRFDALLEEVCTTHSFDPLQSGAFSPDSKHLLLSILHFSLLLLENCMNRKLYASYEWLDKLLATSDWDVLRAVLHLLLLPAQQYSGSGNPRHELPVRRARLAALATVWPPRDAGIGFLPVASESAPPLPAALQTVHTHYYRRRSVKTGDAPGTPAKEGLVRVQIDLHSDPRTPTEIVEATPDRAFMSHDELFELYQKVRVTLAYSHPHTRRQSLVCRLLAMACFSHTMNDAMANARLFLVEPNLIPRLVDLVEPRLGLDGWIQSAALYALESMAHFRHRLQEILAALNASVSHGVLLQSLGVVTEKLCALSEPDAKLAVYVDSLMTLVAYLVTTVTGSTMIVGAGLMPYLIELAKLGQSPHFLAQRTASRAVGLLDNLMFAYPPSFAPFLDAKGPDEMVSCVQIMATHGSTLHAPLAFGQTTFLRNILKMFMHLMAMPGTGDGLRTLVDTSLLDSIRVIMEHRTVFGPQVLSLAVSIMATFVHNEPTLLTIIQEKGLSHVFIQLVLSDTEPNFELITAITTAIGALCLNTAGLEQVAATPLVANLLGILHSPRHQKILLDRDNANAFGASIDELVRHHPSLNAGLQGGIADAMHHAHKEAQQFTPPADEAERAHYVLLPVDQAAPIALHPTIRVQDVKLDEPDNFLSDAIPREINPAVAQFDVVCRFLEGLFRTPQHCKAFIECDGLAHILRFYSTPCLTYNFAASSPADSFVTLLRQMTDISPGSVIVALLREIHASIAPMAPFTQGDTQAKSIYATLLAPSADALSEANTIFRTLVSLNVRAHLLSDICQTFSFAGIKLPLQFLQTLNDGGSNVVGLQPLSDLHRACAFENFLLKAAVADAQPGEGTPLARNITAVSYLASQIPISLRAFFAETVRMLNPRRTVEVAYRPAAMKTAADVGTILHKLVLLRATPNAINNTAELAYELQVVHGLLFGERAPTMHVQTIVLVSFDREGGIDALFARLYELLTILQHHTPLHVDEASITGHANHALRIGLDIVYRLVNARSLIESQHTAVLQQRDMNEPFDPRYMLISLRAKSFAFLRTLWDAPWLAQLPLPTIRLLSDGLLVVLKADSEVAPRRAEEPPGAGNTSLLSSAFGSFPRRTSPLGMRERQVAVDETRVEQLVEMGFSRGSARRALQRTHNNISAATEHIFQHPELADERDELPNVEADASEEMDEDGAHDAANPLAMLAPYILANANEPEAKQHPEKETLDRARDTFKQHMFARALALADAHEPYVFDVKNIFLFLAKTKDESRKLWEGVVQGVESDVDVFGDAQHFLAVRLHLAAILLAAEEVQVQLAWDMLPSFCQTLTQLVEQQSHAMDRKASWFTPALLCLSIALGMAEEMTEPKLGEEPMPLMPAEHATFLHTMRTALLAPALGFLEAHEKISHDALLGVYRLLVLITREASASASFFAQQGVPMLLAPFQARQQGQASGCQRFAVMVLRHVVEYAGIVDALMQREIHVWVANQFRARNSESASFTRGMAYAVSRDMHAFVRAAEKQVEILDFEEGKNQAYLRLRSTEAPPLDDVSGVEAPVAKVVQHLLTELVRVMNERGGEEEEEEKEKNVLGSAQKSPAAEDVHITVESRGSSTMELGDFSAEAAADSEDTSVEAAESVHPAANAAVEPETPSSPSAPLSEAEARLSYMYFLLQSIAELVSSYVSCKQSFLLFHAKMDDDTRSRSILSIFLHRLVPAGFLKNFPETALRKRMAESNLAMMVLVGLTADPAPAPEARQVPESLVAVRKSVLDHLHRVLRDATLSTEPIELRYGRLYAFSDLCTRLLTAQPHQASTSAMTKQHTEVALHMAKTMLEKNFVTVLTSSLADVDLNMPSVKSLLDAVLRPLEHLTKVAMKMAKSARRIAEEEAEAEQQSSTDLDEGTDASMSTDAFDEDDEEEEATAPDFYRNSSLGMHTGEMEHGAYDDEDVSEEEEEDDMDMEEYDSESGSELSTDEEGLDGDAAHVVEVMDEDSQGSEESQDSDQGSGSEEFDDLYDEALSERDYDYVVEDDEHEQEANDVGDILEAIDGMEAGGVLDENDEESIQEDLFDQDAIDQLELEDDSQWPPLPNHGAAPSWDWIQPGRRGPRPLQAPPVHPSTFFLTGEADAQRPLRDQHEEGSPDAAFHPLLDDPDANEHGPRRNMMHNAGFQDMARNMEMLVGGNTMQVLEMLLHRGAQHGQDANIRIEMPQNGRGFPRMHITNLGEGPARPAQPRRRTSDMVAEAHRFTVLPTNLRWAEEARLAHGLCTNEYAESVRHHLINALLPAYRERKRSETSARHENEQALQKTKDMRDETAKQLSDSKRKLQALEDAGDAPQRTDAQPSAPSDAPRVTVSVHGETVDLTDTGIDPTFLEALPDELREEALLGQQPGTRLSDAPMIAPDFLNVLPAALRREIAAAGTGSSGDGEASRPAPAPAPAREPTSLPSTPKPKGDLPRDTIQLLDGAGIATLVRLLYFPQPVARSSLLHKVLSHLSENGKTRAELLQLLLMVLSEGTGNTSAVDRSFSAMSSKAARALSTPQRTPKRALPCARQSAPLSLIGEEAPHLIAARTIETLSSLVHANDHVALFFLTDDIRGKRRGKGEVRTPVNVLLTLLEKDSILSSVQLVDALIALLNAVTRPLSAARKDEGAMLGATLGGQYHSAEVAPVPAEHLSDIVRPLRTAMSSRGFQNTLSVAAHLARLRGARDVLSDALQQEANAASALLVTDLDVLIQSLPPAAAQAASPPRMPSSPLAKLASPTSAQARFLRCLRALDYLYMGK
ncbi:HECT-type E3 ubiquitin transferase [Malassezia vespertilionis]|uniref:UBA domain-containing protein n=1 Tax=Malassezia vespertilionis TaxID=2020962 RepID=A0A2N1JB36_9BASI|nr:HECT-type E3 ubiquitin transferase [Malassezia vespertilionis]PKI83767.1 hypothetical protein MVES_002575 [Malassezia vespertilionis]WFD07364.1 HECT-type E3 ubiquitin transferase [Malassezia vespertilionis]